MSNLYKVNNVCLTFTTPPALKEQVPEEQPNKEGEEADIPHSMSYCPICATIGKDFKARQTVSDQGEEEENSTPKPTVLTPPSQQQKK